jgi:hypothetical protein
MPKFGQAKEKPDTSGFYRNYFLTDPRMYGASFRYNFGAM